MPYGVLNLHNHKGSNWGDGTSILSEFGTEQMEMLMLSALTGNSTFAARAEGVIQLLRQASPDQVGATACSRACSEFWISLAWVPGLRAGSSHRFAAVVDMLPPLLPCI